MLIISSTKEQPSTFVLQKKQPGQNKHPKAFNKQPRALQEGMNKEMKSMLNFDVFEEFKMSDLTPEQLETVISTRWVKTRKSDGTCRCRIVVRGYDQTVEDPDETYASTPSLLTLKTLLTLAVARGWHVTIWRTSRRPFSTHLWMEMCGYFLLWSTTRKVEWSGN